MTVQRFSKGQRTYTIIPVDLTEGFYFVVVLTCKKHLKHPLVKIVNTEQEAFTLGQEFANQNTKESCEKD